MSCRILREQCVKIQSKEPNRLGFKRGGGESQGDQRRKGVHVVRSSKRVELSKSRIKAVSKNKGFIKKDIWHAKLIPNRERNKDHSFFRNYNRRSPNFAQVSLFHVKKNATCFRK